MGPKVFGQTYFEYKKYNTVSTCFIFIQNMPVQRLLVRAVHVDALLSENVVCVCFISFSMKIKKYNSINDNNFMR